MIPESPLKSVLRMACAASVTASFVPAQTPCGASPAPDVIVASVNAPTNYQPAGGVDAAMFGMSECNLGQQLVQHAISPSQHPVFVEGLFRYETVNGAGRFEQIGMSWAFHATN